MGSIYTIAAKKSASEQHIHCHLALTRGTAQTYPHCSLWTLHKPLDATQALYFYEKCPFMHLLLFMTTLSESHDIFHSIIASTPVLDKLTVHGRALSVSIVLATTTKPDIIFSVSVQNMIWMWPWPYSDSGTDTKHDTSTHDPSTGTSSTISWFDLGTKWMSTSPFMKQWTVELTTVFCSRVFLAKT